MLKAGGEVDGFPHIQQFHRHLKNNFWVVQAAVTGESLGACDERLRGTTPKSQRVERKMSKEGLEGGCVMPKSVLKSLFLKF